ncbi:hypothetical protein [Streptomyces sp. TLI_171]|uniref:hypothetical protein n=1 Tax=Streptomyces sp. TLI_171 TaxID=1938859 RepID=UPI000C1A252C|nr:hypothetical protein [Streptomyces sp. TLI_171]RKE20498.1 hypothetical protein BX266_3861 [Streptomyces sp. TLI_171]
MTPTATATAPQGRAYTRRISQIERGYLNANATGTPQLIQMVIEGAGHLDPAELADAVRRSTAVNPGLAVRRKGPNWRAEAELPPITELPADAGFDHPFFHRDLDVVAGPVCELGLSTGAVTRLVVRASHIVTDGRGLRYWIEDLFRALRGEDPVGADSTVDDAHFRTAAAPVPAAPVPPRVPGWPAILGQGPADGTALWLRRSVPATPSAPTARVGAAISRLLAADAGRLIIPVDLRRHDREVRSTANLTSQLVLDLHREDRWNRLHSQLLAAMLRKREVAALDRDFLRNNPFANSLREAQELDGSQFPCTAILTDHGRIDTELYRTAGFRPTEYYTLPMLVPYAEMFLSTCQLDGRTEVTLSCRNRPDARPAAEAVLDEVERALLAAE